VNVQPAIVQTATICPLLAPDYDSFCCGFEGFTSRRDDAFAANSGNNSNNNQLCRREVLNRGRALAG
jgi:hypothetical protein